MTSSGPEHVEPNDTGLLMCGENNEIKIMTSVKANDWDSIKPSDNAWDSAATEFDGYFKSEFFENGSTRKYTAYSMNFNEEGSRSNTGFHPRENE